MTGMGTSAQCVLSGGRGRAVGTAPCGGRSADAGAVVWVMPSGAGGTGDEL